MAHAVAAEVQDPGQSLLCIGQSQHPPHTPHNPHLTPQDPPARHAAAATSQQPAPQQKSAELIDGYQLHIKGDAMDALQSPVCANAQASLPVQSFFASSTDLHKCRAVRVQGVGCK